MFVLHFTEILHDHVLDETTLQSVSCFRMETLDVTHQGVQGVRHDCEGAENFDG